MVKRAVLFFAAIALVGSSANARAADPGRATYFCPWADMVLRIQYDREGGYVAVRSSASIPTPGAYEVDARRARIGGVDVDEVRFEIPDNSFWYTFALQIWPEGNVSLENLRVERGTQKTRSQSGYCFVEE